MRRGVSRTNHFETLIGMALEDKCPFVKTNVCPGPNFIIGWHILILLNKTVDLDETDW